MRFGENILIHDFFNFGSLLFFITIGSFNWAGRPVEFLAIDRHLVDFFPQESVEHDFLAHRLARLIETTLLSHEIVDSMRVDLPLFHLFISNDRLRILRVEVVIRYEGGTLVDAS